MTRRPNRRGRLASERGFTLLEVLMALVIGLLAAGLLYRGAMDGLLGALTADRYQEALSRARSHLEEICSLAEYAPIETIATEGDDGGGFRWRVRVRAAGQTTVATPNLESDPRLPPAMRVKLYAVNVSVSRPAMHRSVNVGLDGTCLGATPLERD